MRIRTRVWIEDAGGNVVYGLGRQRMLQAIRDTGSLTAAAGRLGISYRGLWGRLRLSERRLGFSLVESRPGRGAGAGTKLTAKGQRLLEAYERALDAIYAASDRSFTGPLETALVDRDADPPDGVDAAASDDPTLLQEPSGDGPAAGLQVRTEDGQGSGVGRSRPARK